MNGQPRDPGEQGPRQLHIWDATTREVQVGSLTFGDAEWTLHVVLERAAPDLCRGRLSFRQGEERCDTAAVIVEESEEAVVRRASSFPPSMLRQFLASVRD